MTGTYEMQMAAFAAEDKAREERLDNFRVIGRNNANEALDQWLSFDSLEDAIASYEQNVHDTLIEMKAAPDECEAALNAFAIEAEKCRVELAAELTTSTEF